ncbi:hypothetical protein E2542_SST08877 [Spatholobus suberectus]|nr:hypothetical protein E2542_SST08877 [Spatholobus suberectus]
MSEKEMSERKYITFDHKIVKAQKAAVEKNWKGFKDIFVDNKELLSKPFDLVENTPIHAVARLGKEQLLRELLQMLTETEQSEALRKPNHEENTVLHEVILVEKNPEKMVDTIMKYKIMPDEEPLLELRNDHNETPAFRAAKHGKLRVLKHLHAKYGIEYKHFPPNKYGEKHCPILHTCVLHFQFDVAIWLLEKLDKRLAQQKFRKLQEKNGEENTDEENNEGVTCLKLLSKMPMAFKSTEILKMGLTERLIYELLPGDGYESELEDEAGNNSVKVTRDEESSQQNDENKKTTKSRVGVVFSRVNYAFRKLATKGIALIISIPKIRDRKIRHKLAQRLVGLLLDSEDSWKNCPCVPRNGPIKFSLEFPSNVTKRKSILS